MRKSYIFLSDQVEDIEAITVIDILRRADIPLATISMNEGLTVTSKHGVKIAADELFSAVDFSDAAHLILPGGSTRLNDYPALKELLVSHSTAGGKISAICAAPMVLGGLGLLAGHRACCFPGFELSLIGAQVVSESLVKDGNFITANGPGAAPMFAFAIVEDLRDAAVAEQIKEQMCYI